MNPRIAAHYHDGRRLAPRPVELELTADSLLVHGLEEPLVHPLSAVRCSDRLARVPRFLHLPGGASLETPENDAIDDFLRARGAARGNALIHWLEQRARIAAAATVLLVLTLAATVHYGLPALAHRLAHAVPEDIERQVGRLALRSLDPYYPQSQMPMSRRTEIMQHLPELLRARGITQDVQLEFRIAGQPNAFALPGGVIIITDELVQLATTEELAAVLAHEIAHWQLRHGLQSLFRGSASLVLVSMVTGDLSALTTFAAAVPVLILQKGYSRDFETAADDYAAETLRLAGRDPRHLAAILAKLGAKEKGPAAFSYLSTHPATTDRLARIDPSGTYRELLTAPVDETEEGTPPVEAEQAAPSAKSGQQSPRPLHTVSPVYPFTRRMANEQGVVKVEFIVDKNGRVAAIDVLESPHPEFSDAVTTAVSQWKFEPGKKDGRPVNTRVQQTFPFTLNDAGP